jgi:hypothetical protein
MNVKYLRDYAHCRAGDKGNTSNIAVIVYRYDNYEMIKEILTPQSVKKFFKDRIKGKVERYELPQINALNFVCHDALNGGVTRSLSIDKHGKTFGSGLLMFPIEKNN